MTYDLVRSSRKKPLTLKGGKASKLLGLPNCKNSQES